MNDDIKQQLEKILKRIDRLEDALNRPHIPNYLGGSNTCSECGKVWTGSENYYCSNYNCPIQPKVT